MSAYRGPEVCALAGITYRQLDYWARTGLLQPSIADAQGPGTQRLYSPTDVAVARCIKKLLGRPTSVAAAGNDRLRIAREAEPAIRAAIDGGHAGAALVVTGSGHIAVAENADQLLELVHLHQAVHVFTVPAVDDNTERDTGPEATGPACKTSTGVSTRAARVG